MRKPVLFDSILSLRPDAKFATYGEDYSKVVWFVGEENKPSKQEVETELVRLQAEYETKEYARKRAPEYPSIGDQLDALFKAGAFPADMAAKIQAVKDKYPKV